MKIDPGRSVAWLDARIAAEENPRHRAILENYRTHLFSEVTGNLDLIMGTMSDAPGYHAYSAQNPTGAAGPTTRDEVAAMYREMFDTRVNVLERHFDRLVINDDCLVSEGSIDHAYPGVALLARGRTEDAAGDRIDADAYYLMQYRICAVLPYVGEGTDVRMDGEDTYTVMLPGGPRRIADDEVPDLLKPGLMNPDPMNDTVRS